MLNNFEKGKNREEKIDKFLDNLGWYFSTKAMSITDRTAKRVSELNEEIKQLNANFKKADESSTNLTRALNRITLIGTIIAGLGVIVAILNFIFKYL